MKTPFEILHIAADSDDNAVKRGYLAMVQQFPPERFPEEFLRIRAAYENVKTEKDRLKYALFDHSLPDMNDLAADIKAKAKPGRPTEKQLRLLLEQSAAKIIKAGIFTNE